MDTENHSEKNNKSFHFKDLLKLIKYALILAALIIVIFIIRYQISNGNQKKEQTTIETSAKLEKILQISELSTYQVTFNGVTDVKDDTDTLLYHVSYNAKVGIGLNMEEIRVTIDEGSDENKKIIVTLPEIKITEANVDPGSLDYIFVEQSANTENVSMTALPACKADAEAECRSNDVILELARENAVNTVKALTEPILAQNKEYQLEIQTEGGSTYE